MKAFAGLLDALDRTTSTNERIAAIVAYLRAAEPASAAFAITFLAGRRIPRVLPRAVLRDVVLALTGTPEWLYERCLESVGDGAETCVLLLDRLTPAPADDRPLAAWARDVKLLAKKSDEEQRALVGSWLVGLSSAERLSLVKLLFGEFRVGVSAVLVVRAVAEAFATTPETVAGNLVDFDPFATPTEDDAQALAPLLQVSTERPRPYPFQLAAPLEAAPETLGPREEYLAEWKWDGIRGQALVDDGAVLLWSARRGDRHRHLPRDRRRLAELGALGDDAGRGDFGVRRREAAALHRFADALGAQDREQEAARNGALRLRGVRSPAPPRRRSARARPLAERRSLLETLFAERSDALSRVVTAPSWELLAEERATSRARGVEGLMLKRLDAPYSGGRHRGPSWKWKIDPETIDAVLTYAQPGSGKRANLLTDYTFGIWDGDALVTVGQGVFWPRQTPRSPSWTRSSAPTRSNASVPSGASSRCSSSSSPSTRLALRSATKAASRCVFPASPGGGGTRRRAMRTRSRGCGRWPKPGPSAPTTKGRRKFGSRAGISRPRSSASATRSTMPMASPSARASAAPICRLRPRLLNVTW